MTTTTETTHNPEICDCPPVTLELPIYGEVNFGTCLACRTALLADWDNATEWELTDETEIALYTEALEMRDRGDNR